MDINKDVCINCTKRDNCKIREEIHEDNFYVSECDQLLKEEVIRLKTKDSWRKFCAADKPCWAKGEDGECRTIENCQYKITETEKALAELKSGNNKFCTAYKNGYEQGRKDAAEKLKKEGYRKLPENAIVVEVNEGRELGGNRIVAIAHAVDEHFEKRYEADLWATYKNAQEETVKMLTKGLIDFIQNGTFRKGYELKKVERKIREIAKKCGVKIDDGE